MLKAAALALMAGSILLLGLQRCQGMRRQLKELESYQRALESLESNLRARHDPLPQALRECAEGAQPQTRGYLFALSDCVRAGKHPSVQPPDEASPLPIEALLNGLDLEGVLRLIALCRGQVADQVMERRRALPGHCQAILSASACLAALSVILLI